MKISLAPFWRFIIVCVQGGFCEGLMVASVTVARMCTEERQREARRARLTFLCFVFIFLRQVSLCISDCPRTPSLDLASLELREPLVSASLSAGIITVLSQELMRGGAQANYLSSS